MSVTRTVRPERESVAMGSAEIPPVPLTVEGYSVLHQMMRFRWPAWRGLAAAEKNEIVDEARSVLAAMEENAAGQSGLFSLIGHKGDLMLVHFRQSFAELNQAELQMAGLRLSDYLEPTTSYLSMIELGLYESTIKIYSELVGTRRGAAFGGMEAGDRGDARRGSGRRCGRDCFRSCPSIGICVFIPWTGGVEKIKTGIRFRLKSGRGR